jgi:hypothetical protein
MQVEIQGMIGATRSDGIIRCATQPRDNWHIILAIKELRHNFPSIQGIQGVFVAHFLTSESA